MTDQVPGVRITIHRALIDYERAEIARFVGTGGSGRLEQQVIKPQGNPPGIVGETGHRVTLDVDLHGLELHLQYADEALTTHREHLSEAKITMIEHTKEQLKTARVQLHRQAGHPDHGGNNG